MALDYAGEFNDGRTAARTPVTVRFGRQGLELEGEDGAPVATWAYEDLSLADEPHRRQPVRLAHAAQADARLTVADRGFLRPLLALAPHLRRRGVLGRRPWLRLALGAGGVAAVVAILVYGLPRAAEPVAALVPVEWEEALGQQVAAEFLGGGGGCDGDAGVRALGRLTDRLGAAVESPYQFRVAVADVGDVNAFAAPGGYIVLLRGLIDAADTPDEVAGVLAHEIGHVIERHGTERIIRATGLALLFEILVGDVSGLVGLGAGLAEMLLGLSYSRQDEAEADIIAVRILAVARIRADGLARFLERIADEDGDAAQALAYFSSHPSGQARADAVRAAAGAGGAAMSPADWRALKAICG
ncbi:MAG: M48 family metallopeptidase [Proteobacteria bacterium]|nr:M48 family metallopeptidase [Pseudomonadota bacterium]